MGVRIKFGTDGWRAIIADEYTVENVQRVSLATARWMQNKGMKSVVIGHDCRFGGEMFAQSSSAVFAELGIKVLLARGFVSTPMVSLGVVKAKADMGVVITASHNPASYNGFKLKSSYGGPTIPSEIAEVEERIPETVNLEINDYLDHVNSGRIEFLDLEQLYLDHVVEGFDIQKIRSYGKYLAYDGMYGAGQRIIKRILPEAHLLHCDYNPSFMGQAPEPILRNLTVLSRVLEENAHLKVGLANDGDADRIGMFDENGDFVDSHHLLLLLLYYMFEFKKETGKVIITFSVSDKVKKLAEHYGLDCEVTKIGFKYIAEIMQTEKVIVGGEESGGIAVAGHIPERDGIWMGLLILELMAETGKSLTELIAVIYDKVGSFAFDRDDLHLTEDKKQAIIGACRDNLIMKIGERAIVSTETIDGYKYYLDENSWVMIRPSGTEPVLRVYAQAPTMDQTREILDDTHSTLGKI